MTKDQGATRDARSPAEWVAFAVASAILLVFVGLIASEALRAKDPASPVARVVGEPEKRGDQYVATIEVENTGDETAESVQVVSTLEIGEETFEADQVVDFLSGGEVTEVELVFPEDPDDGTLDVRVSGYALP
ncbi:MAG TPA: hypothetical protein VMY34_05660 [Acidimicrobiales bacterium]|nr:hypothetical protein [Acidimicrobiales bacterium]